MTDGARSAGFVAPPPVSSYRRTASGSGSGVDASDAHAASERSAPDDYANLARSTARPADDDVRVIAEPRQNPNEAIEREAAKPTADEQRDLRLRVAGETRRLDLGHLLAIEGSADGSCQLALLRREQRWIRMSGHDDNVGRLGGLDQ